MVADSFFVYADALERYREYLVETGQHDNILRRQYFTDGYAIGLRKGLEFSKFLSKRGVKHGRRKRRSKSES